MQLKRRPRPYVDRVLLAYLHEIFRHDGLHHFMPLPARDALEFVTNNSNIQALPFYDPFPANIGREFSCKLQQEERIVK